MRSDSQKRIKRFLKFLTASDTYLQLAEASLCCSVAMVATNATGKRGGEPLLVRLAKGDIITQCCSRMAEVLSNLHFDLVLQAHLGRVVERLLVTTAQVCIRFRQYTAYPAKVVLMAKTFNEKGFFRCHHCVSPRA